MKPRKGPPLIALTGSIGSGKSEAAAAFKSLGAAILDADELAREAVRPGTPALKEIVDAFGGTVLTPSGELDRKTLGHLVFSDPSSREKLEDILHPRIRQLYRKHLLELQKSSPQPSLIVYVVPLYFETRHGPPESDAVVVVAAPREVSIARIMARDSCSRELAEKKYDAQIPIEEKVAKTKFVISNTSSLTALRSEVQRVYDMLRSEIGRSSPKKAR